MAAIRHTFLRNNYIYLVNFALVCQLITGKNKGLLSPRLPLFGTYLSPAGLLFPLWRIISNLIKLDKKSHLSIQISQSSHGQSCNLVFLQFSSIIHQSLSINPRPSFYFISIIFFTCTKFPACSL